MPRAFTQALLGGEGRNGRGQLPHSTAPLPWAHGPCYPALTAWLRVTACPWLTASGQGPSSGALPQTSVPSHGPPPPPVSDTYRRVSCSWRLQAGCKLCKARACPAGYRRATCTLPSPLPAGASPDHSLLCAQCGWGLRSLLPWTVPIG